MAGAVVAVVAVAGGALCGEELRRLDHGIVAEQGERPFGRNAVSRREVLDPFRFDVRLFHGGDVMRIGGVSCDTR